MPQIDFGYAEASGLPPFMSPQPEAGAIPARDASTGLATTVIDSQTWAANPAMGGEMQLVYEIEPGGPVSSGGLFALAQELYGNGNLWRQIYDVPQNKAIQGSDPNTGLYLGDVILIPGLEPAQDPGGTQQTPGNGLTPVTTGPGDDRTIVFNGPPGGNGELTTVSRTIETTTTKETEKQKEGWWTPGRAAVAAGVGVGAVVVTVLVFTGKKKPRRRRRRRTRRRK